MVVRYTTNYIKSKRDLDRIFKLGETAESTAIDFKQELNVGVNKVAEETALDICQFSNSLGGVILVGVVEEKSSKTGKKVATKYVNVDHDTISQFVNDKVLPMIYPRSIPLDIISIELESTKSITAINVAPLATGIACVAQNSPPYKGKYPYRTHYGKKYYSPLEVEKNMTNTFRHITIKLLEMFAKDKEVSVYPTIIKEEAKDNLSWDDRDSTVIIKNVGESEFTLNIAGIDINIPYSLTKDVWETESDKIGILLDVKLIISADRRNIYFDL